MIRVEELVTTLPNDFYGQIEQKIHKVICAVDQVFIYEGQTPIVAYVLISGRARLSKRRTFTDIQDPFSLIGARKFLYQAPFPYTLTIEEGSQLGFIDRSTLLSILNEDKIFLFDFSKEEAELKD